MEENRWYIRAAIAELQFPPLLSLSLSLDFLPPTQTNNQSLSLSLSLNQSSPKKKNKKWAMIREILETRKAKKDLRERS